MAWLGGDEPTANVLIEVADGVITRVSTNVDAPAGAHRLRGLTLPGLANTHSHVFHRAIRGRSQSGVADFWSWRTLMYEVAERLDPDSLYALAHATYAEMALSGITSVGEFFYLHHDQGGKKYANP
ncbi:MAG: amidohydrolase family protein, partial [Salinibacterium sp.]|nr:amidohydrolase family protein [Salinibacterium sp.]